jgi:hypothetical protein
VIGCFGDCRINDNGERVINMCLYSMSCLCRIHGSSMKKIISIRDISQRSIIDLVIYDKRLKELVNDTRVYRGSECGSDPFLVVSCMNLGMKWRYKQADKVQMERIWAEKLQNEDVRAKYGKLMNESLHVKWFE